MPPLKPMIIMQDLFEKAQARRSNVCFPLATLRKLNSDSCHEFGVWRSVRGVGGCASGWCAQPGVGQALEDRLVDGSEPGTQFGWRVGLAVGGK